MNELTNKKTAKLFIRGFLEAKKNEDKDDNSVFYAKEILNLEFADNEELLEYIKGAISILNKAKEEIETELNIL